LRLRPTSGCAAVGARRAGRRASPAGQPGPRSASAVQGRSRGALPHLGPRSCGRRAAGPPGGPGPGHDSPARTRGRPGRDARPRAGRGRVLG